MISSKEPQRSTKRFNEPQQTSVSWMRLALTAKIIPFKNPSDPLLIPVRFGSPVGPSSYTAQIFFESLSDPFQTWLYFEYLLDHCQITFGYRIPLSNFLQIPFNSTSNLLWMSFKSLFNPFLIHFGSKFFGFLSTST